MTSGKPPRSRGPDDKKAILIALITLMGLVLAAIADRVLGSVQDGRAETVAALRTNPETGTTAPVAPVGFQAAIEAIGGAEQGRNGLFVSSVEGDWVAGYRGATTFSQGTTRRVWLGAALLDAVERGELSLEQQVPLLAEKRGSRPPRRQLGELLRRAMADDDRVSQDHILDGLTGPQGIARWLEEKDIAEVAYGPANRDLEKATTRPADAATPDGMAFGLGQLYAGKLIGSSSAERLLSYFPVAHALLDETAAGWQVRILTGETRGAKRRVVAASGAAFIRSRAGRHYTIVVFADGPADPAGRRDRLFASAFAALVRTEMR